MTNIYDIRFVENLFDEMANSYEAVNYVTSFGFSKRWRRQFVQKAQIGSDMEIYEFMCGMGECWSAILPYLKQGCALTAFDLSQNMLKGATKRQTKYQNLPIALHKQNVLENDLPDESADCIIAAFGLKTFSDEQKEIFAAEIKRILKPNGTFSMIEVSVPPAKLLRRLYMFYLKNIIPIFGRIFLGNPENYRMLGVYTEKFQNCRVMSEIMERQGFAVQYHHYFYGCATGISGTKVNNSLKA